jgi:hypothetical protein
MAQRACLVLVVLRRPVHILSWVVQVFLARVVQVLPQWQLARVFMAWVVLVLQLSASMVLVAPVHQARVSMDRRVLEQRARVSMALEVPTAFRRLVQPPTFMRNQKVLNFLMAQRRRQPLRVVLRLQAPIIR